METLGNGPRMEKWKHDRRETHQRMETSQNGNITEWKHHGMEVSVYGVWSMGMDAPTLDMSLNLSSSENMLDEREFMMTSV